MFPNDHQYCNMSHSSFFSPSGIIPMGWDLVPTEITPLNAPRCPCGSGRVADVFGCCCGILTYETVSMWNPHYSEYIRMIKSHPEQFIKAEEFLPSCFTGKKGDLVFRIRKKKRGDGNHTPDVYFSFDNLYEDINGKIALSSDSFNSSHNDSIVPCFTCFNGLPKFLLQRNPAWEIVPVGVLLRNQGNGTYGMEEFYKNMDGRIISHGFKYGAINFDANKLIKGQSVYLRLPNESILGRYLPQIKIIPFVSSISKSKNKEKSLQLQVVQEAFSRQKVIITRKKVV